MTNAEIEREIDREDRLSQLYDLADRYVKAAKLEAKRLQKT